MTTLRRVLQLSKKEKHEVDDEPSNRHSRSRRKRRTRLVAESIAATLKKEKSKKKKLKAEDKQDKVKNVQKEEPSKKMTTRSASRGVIASVVPQVEKLEIEVPKKNKSSRARAAVVDVSWVQCDKCKEWYVLPQQVDQTSLPQNWFCEMISWSFTKSYHRQQCKLRQSGGHIPPKKQVLQKEVSQTQDQWVECDDCGKWRKIPSFVNTAKLPAKWFCYMNVYDPLHNSCRIAQERYQDQQQVYVYNHQENDTKRKKSSKLQAKALPGGYDQSHILNKLIKTRLRQRGSSFSFVYGIDEKKLKKSKRNPCSFKELIWWHHNGLQTEEFSQCQKEDLHTHFKASSLYLAHSESPSSKKRKVKYLSSENASPTTFHKLFLSQESKVGSLLTTAARARNIQISLLEGASASHCKSQEAR